MTSAWVYKEFQETRGIAFLGGVAMLAVAVAHMGWSPLPGLLGTQQQARIPFLYDNFPTQFGLAAFAMATALGLLQSLWDFRGDAQLFLLHRPMSRGRVYAVKLLVGMTLCLFCGLLSVALYAGWAAWPGSHASPFAWSMTWSAWNLALVMTTVYLGAFLSGLRPARWFGTRLAPLAAAAVVVTIVVAAPGIVSLGLIALADVLFLLAILHTAAVRDFD